MRPPALASTRISSAGIDGPVEVEQDLRPAHQHLGGRGCADAKRRSRHARIERQLSRLSGQEEKLHAQMAEQAGDHTALMSLDATLRALHAERAALEEEWLTAAELAG